MTSKRGKRKAVSWNHRCLLQKVDWLGKLEEYDTLSYLNNILNTSGPHEVTACSVMSPAKRSQLALGAAWKMEKIMSSAVTLPCLCPLQICFIYRLCLFADSIAVLSLRWRTNCLFTWLGSLAANVYGSNIYV